MIDTSNLKQRFSDADLEEFRILIQNKIKKAQAELDFYATQLTELTESSDSKIKGMDDGIGTSENERLSVMAIRQRKLIQHLDSALLRIQNGTYGICRISGELMAKNRLLAVPHATMSVEAKELR